MLRIRIVAAGAGLVMTVAAASAQTATATAPGKPLPLLQILQQTFRGKPAPRVRTLRKTASRKTTIKVARKAFSKRRRVAAKENPPPLTPVSDAATATTVNVWPPAAANPTVALTAATAVAPAPQPAAAPEPDPSELVVDGQTVQVASPDDVNAIDLAAGKATAVPDTATPSNTAAAEAAPPAPQTLLAKIDPPDANANPVGSASWIAQLLAGLGGAVAAGSIAWFLIGPAAPRIYG